MATKIFKAKNGRLYKKDAKTGRAVFLSSAEVKQIRSEAAKKASSAKKKKTTKSTRSKAKNSTARKSSTGTVTLTKKAATDLHDLLYDLATGAKRSASVIDRHLMALKRKI